MVSSWNEHAELEAPCFKRRKLPAGPERLLCGGLSPAPAAYSGVAGSCQTVRPEGCRGIWTFCTVGDLGASGHVALLLLALKTKWKLSPCSSWAVEAPWGCSLLQLNPLPTAEACGKQGWCWSCSGLLGFTESTLSPLCLSAPGRLAREAAPHRSSRPRAWHFSLIGCTAVETLST